MEEDGSKYLDGPPLNSFVDLTENYSRLMSFRNSAKADHHQVQKRGRFLREMRELQLIQYDLQHYNMILERKQMQEETLFLAQQFDFLSDPENVQRAQLTMSNSDYTYRPEYKPQQQMYRFPDQSQNVDDNFMSNPSFDSLEIPQASNIKTPTQPGYKSRFRR